MQGICLAEWEFPVLAEGFGFARRERLVTPQLENIQHLLTAQISRGLARPFRAGKRDAEENTGQQT